MLLSGISIQIARAQCGVTSSTYNGTTTANYIPKFNNTTGCISNSQIQDNATNVGIGVSPSYKLDVNGDVNAGGSSPTTTNALRLGTNKVLWHNGNVEDIFIGVEAGNNAMTGHYNTFMGNEAGKYQTSGTNSTYVGNRAGYGSSDGDYNTFVGSYAGGAAGDGGGGTTGDYNTIVGASAGLFPAGDHTYSRNSLLGYNAGQTLLDGNENVFLGYFAGTNNQSASHNVFAGSYSGFYNSTGTNNSYLGTSTGYHNTTGSYNTISGMEAGRGTSGNNYSYNSFYGYRSGYSNTTGANNVFSGYQSGYSNTTGAQNIFMGSQSGYNNTTGANNVFSGFKAGYSNTTGGNNVFAGNSAGYSNTTASHNIFMGYNSGYANTTAAPNIGIGAFTLQSNTSGIQNTAIGYSSLSNNTTGQANIGVGLYSLLSNTSGSNNVASGIAALYSNTTGGVNTAIGHYALANNTAGNSNTALGGQALRQTTTGGTNTAIGQFAGYQNKTGSNNTFVGQGADTDSIARTNATAIGAGAIVTKNNAIQLGNSTTSNGVFTSSGLYQTSDGRFKTNVTENVKGLEFINKLRPVTYQMDANAFDDYTIQNWPDSLKIAHKQGQDFASASAIIHSGFIAQEVELAAQDVNLNSSIVHHPANATDPYAIAYAEIVVPLVKAVQELSKQNDSLKTLDSAKNARVQEIENKLNELVTNLNSCCQQTKSMGVNNTSEMQSIVHSENIELSNRDVVVLNQNVPNPFAEQTTISYYLPENTGRAQIIFLDQNSKLIKVVELTQKGNGKLNVFAQDLSNSIYTYSLIVDGQTIETKKMIKQ